MIKLIFLSLVISFVSILGITEPSDEGLSVRVDQFELPSSVGASDGRITLVVETEKPLTLKLYNSTVSGDILISTRNGVSSSKVQFDNLSGRDFRLDFFIESDSSQIYSIFIPSIR